MKRKTLGKLFAMAAVGVISTNAPTVAKAEELSENKEVISSYAESGDVSIQHTEPNSSTEEDTTNYQSENNVDINTDSESEGNKAADTDSESEENETANTDDNTDSESEENEAVNTDDNMDSESEENKATDTDDNTDSGLEENETADINTDSESEGNKAIYTNDNTDSELEENAKIDTEININSESEEDKAADTDNNTDSESEENKAVDTDNNTDSKEGQITDKLENEKDATENNLKESNQTSVEEDKYITDAPSDFAEAEEKLIAAEKEAENAQIELDKIQAEINEIQTGEQAAQKKVEETGAIKKQAEEEKIKAEEEKEKADTIVSNAKQEAEDAQAVWETVTDSSDKADTLQAGKEQLSDKKTEVLNAENAVEELETELTEKENEVDNVTYEKLLAESSVASKEESKNNADKAVSNAQADLEKAQKDYELACEAEKLQGTESNDGKSDSNSTEEDIDEIVNALTAAKEKAALGSLGFFQYLAETEDSTSAKAAIAILTSQDGTDAKGLRPSYVWMAESWEQFYAYTHIGDEKDATSLENMKRAIAFIEECNQLRTTDNNFQGCEPLVVNDAVIAIAQLNANWATFSDGSYNSHATVFNTNENLAWYYLDRPGSDDPFEGWYDREKAIYDNKSSGITGHYLNITNKDLSVTGFGVNLSEDSSGATRINCAQEFIREIYYGGYGFGETYSVDEYRERFNQYYYNVMTELNNAQAAYDSISGMAGAQTAAKKAALYQAQGKLESAKADANKAQILLSQALEQKAACEQQYNIAIEALEKIKQELKTARDVLDQKTEEYQALEETMKAEYGDASSAMIALTDAEAAYKKALMSQEKAANALEQAQEAYNEASAANTKAVQEWNNIKFASLAEKNEELKSAQDRYAQAFENLFVAQGYYDMLNPNQGNVIPSEIGSTIVPDKIKEPVQSGDIESSKTAQQDTMSESQDNSVTIQTTLDHSTRAIFSNDCSFANFVKASSNIFTESTSEKLVLDCLNTPWFSLSKRALSALKSSPNTSLTILYRYGGKKYSFTIPAGFDFDQLQDFNGWYGFMYLKMVFGGHEIN